MTTTPEFRRALEAMGDAINAADAQGEDLRSLASCFLSHSAAFYARIHGTHGADGLLATLGHVVTLYDQRSEAERGPTGRA